uniref:Uncharacterized protein n=1 Tax=Anguilla anguilla TaxID=7936 RepID=A0A0E9S9T3_ANGAN
MSALSDSSDTY